MNPTESIDFEFLDHDEAFSVFKSPRPSYTFDELEKLAVRERLMKEAGDYSPGYPFRFEIHNTFSLNDIGPRPLTGIHEEHGVGFGAINLSEGPSILRPVISAPMEVNPWKNGTVERVQDAGAEEEIEELGH